jgi:hypothetical protein
MLQSKFDMYVIQEYKVDMFPYNRTKFYIGTYCLITCIRRVMKACLFQEEYIRTSSDFYWLYDLTYHIIHLTNDSIQKHGKNYGRCKFCSKTSYHDLQKYIDSNHQQTQLTFGKLVDDMKSIIH